ncbi:MAG TPA: S8 family serine peptidase [Gaiellaceae bacterium]|nr:S8 family serine peptidase [Gaiellaceae bacterium]
MPRRIVVLLALACANLLLLAVAEASSGHAETVAPGAVVAIVDSGVDAAALQGARVLPPIDLVDRAGGGEDASGHGTAVASVVAAECPQCALLPVRVLAGDAAAPWERVAAGIVAAVDAGARVVNVSIAGPGGSPELRNAVRYAAARDVVVVAAAGNAGGETASFPAAYPEVVAVTAVDASGVAPEWATRGGWADVAASGCAAVPIGGATTLACGTSFAAPRVAAAAALVRGSDPSASAAAVAARLPRVVRPAASPAPRLRIAGSPQPGSLVRAAADGIDNELGASIRWFRCDAAACSAVGGSSYRVTARDRGAVLVARLVTKPFGHLWAAATPPLHVR